MPVCIHTIPVCISTMPVCIPSMQRPSYAFLYAILPCQLASSPYEFAFSPGQYAFPACSSHAHHAATILCISGCNITMPACIVTIPVCIFIMPVCIPSMDQPCSSCSGHPKQLCMQYNLASLHRHHTSMHFHQTSMHSQHGAAMLIMQQPSYAFLDAI